MRSYVDDARDHLVRLRRAQVVVPTAAPTWRSRWQRLLFGLTLPFVIGNACLTHPELGPKARRTLLAQAGIAALFGVFWYFVFDVKSIDLGNGGRLTFGDGATGIVAFVGALSLTEWLVIALSRELHDDIGVGVARLLGVPPDEEVVDPRVRLNLPWLFTKMRRRIQGAFVMFVSVVPAVIVVGVACAPLIPAIGDGISLVLNLIASLIIFYWIAVVALGKTSWAWRSDPDRDPAPLRALDFVGGASGALFVFRWWSRTLRRTMAMMVRPARLLESCPWEMAGVAVARLLMSLPVTWIVVRPFFPVASTLVLQARAPQVFAPPEPAVVVEPAPVTTE